MSGMQCYTDPLRRWTPPRVRVYIQTMMWRDKAQEMDRIENLIEAYHH